MKECLCTANPFVCRDYVVTLGAKALNLMPLGSIEQIKRLGDCVRFSDAVAFAARV
jgi:hypothetical protein